MGRAFSWGIGLFVAAALCGILNVAGAYADNGKVAMGILAGLLFLASLLFFIIGQGKRTASHRDISAAQPSMGDRTVKSYRAYDFSTKMGAMDRIEQRKEWAIVRDTYEHPDQPYWEVWSDGKLKDTVFSEREALESMHKYLSGEYT